MDQKNMTVKQTIKAFGKTEKDTGGSATQIALLTRKILLLAGHFKLHKKDFHSRRGLLKMISRRKKLLNYLKKSQPGVYQKTIQELSLRK